MPANYKLITHIIKDLRSYIMESIIPTMSVRGIMASGLLALPLGLVVYRFLFPRHAKNSHRKLGAWVCSVIMRRIHDKCVQQKTELFKAFDLIPGERPLGVLEIGVGAGSNLAFLPQDCRLTCLEPNPHNQPFVQRALAAHPGITLTRFVQGFAEDMSAFQDDSFDAVVLTFTLCSVYSPDKALKEIKRVLKPGGIFFFMEHVAAPAGSGHRWLQEVGDYVWPTVADNCHLAREAGATIQATGFSHVKMDHCRVKVFRPLSFGLYGYCVK